MAELGRHKQELAGRGERPPPGFFAGPRTSFNGAVSNRKRFASLSVPLDDVKLVGHVFEATVTDVVMATVSGGLRRLLEARGEPRESFACRRGPGLDPGGRGDRRAGEPDLGHARVVGVRRRRTGGAPRRGGGVLEGGQGPRTTASSALPRRPGAARRSGADDARLARALAGTRLFDRVRPPANVTVSSIRGPGVPLFLRRQPGERRLSDRADRRGYRRQRDGDVVRSSASTSASSPAASSCPSCRTSRCTWTTRWRSSPCAH